MRSPTHRIFPSSDVSLKNVAARKDDLPVPALPRLETLLAKPINPSNAPASPPAHRNSVDDPWRSSQPAPPAVNGYSSRGHPNPATTAASPYTGGSFTATHFNTTSTDSPPAPLAIPPSLSNPGGVRQEEYQWFLDMDLIKVTVAPEREGFLLFKHVNYIVESQQRASTATRRFSDFWWLMETLGKRYPFRILPNMPPKKLGGIDDAFLEKRRKGLARFINFVARHPVLRADEVVVAFLTEPTEFVIWRRQFPPSVEEEFARKRPSPADFESQIPVDLDDRLEKVRKRLGPSIEHYKNMCFILEKFIRRYESAATDYVRYGSTLNMLGDTEKQCHLEDCHNCGQVVRGYQQVSAYMERASTILEEQANADNDGVLENLKRHRDLLVSVKELFDRKDRLSGNTIELVQKRIAGNQIKLAAAREQAGQEDMARRLEKTVENDFIDIEYQKHRAIHIRFSLHQELSLYHKQMAFVSILYQGYVNSQIKYAQRTMDNWKALSGPVYDMPVETTGFG
ncbi:hypothetical protein BC936DRAFT_147597 [Jimgerdemannia flammicorona]|uniref:Sorting nexin MVP1 n=1 Tax=Jimgerdemannia flammicorona TaxID=994334 RepID=A0A433D4Z7_9FUNG|nr:hypothetical protein BC936DRAFT_147597 [Jimgerdemannia flammicorona]